MTDPAMTTNDSLPRIIQGGMGIGISNWKLARGVALCGQLGVVSGTAIDSVLVRRLQDGDPEGHVRRAIARFPIPEVGDRILRRYFLPDGRKPGEPYRLLPMYNRTVGRARHEVTILANFVEVYLAREGHSGPIGINLLTKVQTPNLASLYGAMLAGVDYVLMGAGIPKEIPQVLDRLAGHEPVSLRFDVEGLERGETEYLTFDPGDFIDQAASDLLRPRFLPIVSTDSLAVMMARKANGRVDGIVIEGPTAGGHNAPPRGPLRLDDRGEPIYGDRDLADLEKVRELGLPFWLAGGVGSPEGLAAALDAGAAGIQVGTLFAYASESGMRSEYRASVLDRVRSGAVDVFTDPYASPTGFPFKVVELPGSLSDEKIYEERERSCDLGYLRVAAKGPDGRIVYRCPAEPVQTYEAKGGSAEDTVGRMCLCNALMADIGLGQIREGGRVEPPLLTSGDDLTSLGCFLSGRESYTVSDVITYLLAGEPAPEMAGASRFGT